MVTLSAQERGLQAQNTYKRRQISPFSVRKPVFFVEVRSFEATSEYTGCISRNSYVSDSYDSFAWFLPCWGHGLQGCWKRGVILEFAVQMAAAGVSVSAMLVSMRQKKYRSSFYSWAIFFCFHLSGSRSRYLLSGVRGGIAAALFMISDIYLKKLTPCNLHEHASE